MSEQLDLKAADGHKLHAYMAVPEQTIDGGLVVLQEIFGVNSHIRSVVDRFGSHRFLAVAPALFDRVEQNVELGYGGADFTRAVSLMRRLKWEGALMDVSASLKYVQERVGKPSGVVGYCYGGTLAWLSATRLNPAAVVCYYGGHIARYAEEEPNCPVMMHFGRKDEHISQKDVNRIQELHPEVPLYRYDAGHGFNCDARESFNAVASAEAFERTLSFLRDHLTTH